MFRVATLIGVVALTGMGVLAGGGSASAEGFDVCGEDQYVVDLYVDLSHDTPPGDRAGAAARAQQFAANAPAEIKADAVVLTTAETSVLDGAPASVVFMQDPVIQAWGDVMDWRTVHCLGATG